MIRHVCKVWERWTTDWWLLYASSAKFRYQGDALTARRSLVQHSRETCAKLHVSGHGLFRMRLLSVQFPIAVAYFTAPSWDVAG